MRQAPARAAVPVSGMYPANSMNCLSEAIGMALPGNGTIPAVHAAYPCAKHAGMKIMELLEKDIKPRDILTEKAFRNALTCKWRSAARPIPYCICWQLPMKLVKVDLHLLNELSAKVPNLCHLAPAGPHHIEELRTVQVESRRLCRN